jgi:hypothetical protein
MARLSLTLDDAPERTDIVARAPLTFQAGLTTAKLPFVPRYLGEF